MTDPTTAPNHPDFPWIAAAPLAGDSRALVAGKTQLPADWTYDFTAIPGCRGCARIWDGITGHKVPGRFWAVPPADEEAPFAAGADPYAIERIQELALNIQRTLFYFAWLAYGQPASAQGFAHPGGLSTAFSEVWECQVNAPANGTTLQINAAIDPRDLTTADDYHCAMNAWQVQILHPDTGQACYTRLITGFSNGGYTLTLHGPVIADTGWTVRIAAEIHDPLPFEYFRPFLAFPCREHVWRVDVADLEPDEDGWVELFDHNGDPCRIAYPYAATTLDGETEYKATFRVVQSGGAGAGEVADFAKLKFEHYSTGDFHSYYQTGTVAELQEAGATALTFYYCPEDTAAAWYPTQGACIHCRRDYLNSLHTYGEDFAGQDSESNTWYCEQYAERTPPELGRFRPKWCYLYGTCSHFELNRASYPTAQQLARLWASTDIYLAHIGAITWVERVNGCPSVGLLLGFASGQLYSGGGLPAVTDVTTWYGNGALGYRENPGGSPLMVAQPAFVAAQAGALADLAEWYRVPQGGGENPLDWSGDGSGTGYSDDNDPDNTARGHRSRRFHSMIAGDSDWPGNRPWYYIIQKDFSGITGYATVYNTGESHVQRHVYMTQAFPAGVGVTRGSWTIGGTTYNSLVRITDKTDLTEETHFFEGEGMSRTGVDYPFGLKYLADGDGVIEDAYSSDGFLCLELALGQVDLWGVNGSGELVVLDGAAAPYSSGNCVNPGIGDRLTNPGSSTAWRLYGCVYDRIAEGDAVYIENVLAQDGTSVQKWQVAKAEASAGAAQVVPDLPSGVTIPGLPAGWDTARRMRDCVWLRCDNPIQQALLADPSSLIGKSVAAAMTLVSPGQYEAPVITTSAVGGADTVVSDYVWDPANGLLFLNSSAGECVTFSGWVFDREPTTPAEILTKLDEALSNMGYANLGSMFGSPVSFEWKEPTDSGWSLIYDQKLTDPGGAIWIDNGGTWEQEDVEGEDAQEDFYTFSSADNSGAPGTLVPRPATPTVVGTWVLDNDFDSDVMAKPPHFSCWDVTNGNLAASFYPFTNFHNLTADDIGTALLDVDIAGLRETSTTDSGTWTWAHDGSGWNATRTAYSSVTTTTPGGLLYMLAVRYKLDGGNPQLESFGSSMGTFTLEDEHRTLDVTDALKLIIANYNPNDGWTYGIMPMLHAGDLPDMTADEFCHDLIDSVDMAFDYDPGAESPPVEGKCLSTSITVVHHGYDFSGLTFGSLYVQFARPADPPPFPVVLPALPEW